MRKVRRRLSSEVRALRGAAPIDVIRRLNPIIRGWAAYYRPSVASDAFHKLDDHLWPRLFKWALRRHPRKSRRWVVARYFGQFNKTRQDRWVFGDRDSGAYLHRFTWTKIVRHPLVTGAASPDDPALAQYWADRRGKRLPQMGFTTKRLIRKQDGRCPICDCYLLHTDHEPQSPQQWEQWFATIGKAMTRQLIVSPQPGRPDERRRLVHTSCLRRQQRQARDPASPSNACTPKRPA
jgi:RNA-directed DNA polymerase